MTKLTLNWNLIMRPEAGILGTTNAEVDAVLDWVQRMRTVDNCAYASLIPHTKASRNICYDYLQRRNVLWLCVRSGRTHTADADPRVVAQQPQRMHLPYEACLVRSREELCLGHY